MSEKERLRRLADKLCKENAELKRKLEDQQRIINVQQGRITSLERELKTRDNMAAQGQLSAADHQRQVGSLTAEINLLREDIGIKNSGADQLRQTIERNEVEVNQLRARFEKSEEDKSRLQHSLIDQTELADSRRRQIERLVEEKKSSIIEHNAEVEGLTNNVRQFAANEIYLQQEIDRQRDEIKALKIVSSREIAEARLRTARVVKSTPYYSMLPLTFEGSLQPSRFFHRSLLSYILLLPASMMLRPGRSGFVDALDVAGPVSITVGVASYSAQRFLGKTSRWQRAGVVAVAAGAVFAVISPFLSKGSSPSKGYDFKFFALLTYVAGTSVLAEYCMPKRKGINPGEQRPRPRL